MRADAIRQPLIIFPREFEKRLWDDLDKRFYMILITSWLSVYTLVTVLGNLEYDRDAHYARARAVYMEMIKNYPISKILEPTKAEEPDQMTQDFTSGAAQMKQEISERPNSFEGQGSSAVEMIRQRRANEATRFAARKQMENEVGQTGILGMLSSGTGDGSGSAVIDAFIGEGIGGAADLEEMLSGVSGLATVQGSAERTRLGQRQSGRIYGTADVNELISGVGPVGSTSIGRKGTIAIALESARISGAGSRATFRSNEEISGIIIKHSAAIEYCYKRETKLNPNLAGDILVEFIIGANGIVKSVKILQSTLGNSSMEHCIVQRIRGWRFKSISTAEGDVLVKQKYIFN